MLNVVAIMGRLARDPELRQTTTGKNVASFRIACDRGRRDANGQSQADWIDVVAWDRQAEFVCKYFQKGSLIVVDGRLQSRSYHCLLYTFSEPTRLRRISYAVFCLKKKKKKKNKKKKKKKKKKTKKKKKKRKKKKKKTKNKHRKKHQKRHQRNNQNKTE